ncbi:hypothetical protein [Desulfitobacterium sp. AusDCA]|uniref:hypothetical protein n=1 Tax=Desulfitobacterium sp. AusDCA TaxID=3240383 RepID=UPI003DA6FA9C
MKNLTGGKNSSHREQEAKKAEKTYLFIEFGRENYVAYSNFETLSLIKTMKFSYVNANVY